MKKLYKVVFFWSLPFVTLIFFLFFLNIIKKDFIYAHFLKTTYKAPYNWFYDFTIIPFKKFYIDLTNDKEEYFPQIKLYVKESNINYLLSDLPNSTKVWQKAKIIHDHISGELRDSNFRFRGDNPENWLFEKKSIRVKFKKKDMNGRQRYYDYLPFEERLLTSYRIALGAKIFSPKIRLVEVFIKVLPQKNNRLASLHTLEFGFQVLILHTTLKVLLIFLFSILVDLQSSYHCIHCYL